MIDDAVGPVWIPQDKKWVEVIVTVAPKLGRMPTIFEFKSKICKEVERCTYTWTPGMGVTKTPVFVKEILEFAGMPLRFLESLSYVTGVIAVHL